ncbi:amino acid adenylation domain-containing protein [Lachnospiraceae bacterium]|nr:amino acid adenylation domain-containing protein [Lachnospiraceae bacterium]
MEKNVLEWLEKTGRIMPDKVAYEDSAESVTFRQVMEEARRMGSRLAEKVTDPAPIAVMMGRNVHTIISYLAVVYSGHVYAPIDAALPEDRINKILDTLRPSAVFTEENFAETASKYAEAAKCPLYTREELNVGMTAWPILNKIRTKMTEIDPLYVIFTSGSSGRPKGVLTSHHSLMCYISSYTHMMSIKTEDRIGCQSPLDYIAAVRDIYVPLLTGASDHLVPKEYFMQPDELFNFMNEKEITAVGWSTSALTVLTKLGVFEDTKLTTLKKICFSGSVMPGKVLKKWQENLPDAVFVNQYGPTEATASCTYFRIDHVVAEDEVLPIGVPYDNYKVFLLKDNGEEAAVGEEGEICVSGPILALGYYRDPERTEEAFTRNPLVTEYYERMYRTGDIGKFREDGILEFHGRRDRQVKHMGHRVELDEIEAAASQSAGVAESAVLYDHSKEVIWLFYSGEAEKRDLVLFLRTELPGFMVPRKVNKLEDLPKLPNGKTDISSLKSIAGII